MTFSIIEISLMTALGFVFSMLFVFKLHKDALWQSIKNNSSLMGKLLELSNPSEVISNYLASNDYVLVKTKDAEKAGVDCARYVSDILERKDV